MEKTVLYVGRFKLPYGTAAAQRVKVNKMAIEKAGYKVRFVSTFEEDTDFLNIENNFNINNINHKKYLYDISYIKNILNNVEENVYAVIFYNFPSVSLWRFTKYLKKKNIKVLADCTEWYDIPRNSSMARKTVKFLDTEFRMRIAHKKVDGLICISSYLENYYKSAKVKTTLIPNLLDLQDEKWRFRYKDIENEIQDQINIVYAGNPGKNFEKENLDTIVDVFSEVSKSMSNTRLEIIGITKKDFFRIYYRKHERNPDIHNVIFHGRKSHLDVIRTVQESDYFIFFRPITKANVAGFPTKLVEAFGALTPTITNDVGDVKKYIKNGVNGYLFESIDPDFLKQELKAILKQHYSHGSLRKELKTDNPFDYNLFTQNFIDILK